jgi:hypothetical protein
MKTTGKIRTRQNMGRGTSTFQEHETCEEGAFSGAEGLRVRTYDSSDDCGTLTTFKALTKIGHGDKHL